MNITKELDQIIVKYQLDEYYPRYRLELRDEAVMYFADIMVIDLYTVFEQMDYCFKQDFYATMGLQESDYDHVYRNEDDHDLH